MQPAKFKKSLNFENIAPKIYGCSAQNYELFEIIFDIFNLYLDKSNNLPVQ